MPDPEPQRKLTLDEAAALMDKYTVVAESEADKAKKKKQVTEVKDLLTAGAKQGRAGLGVATRNQLKQLEEQGY